MKLLGSVKIVHNSQLFNHFLEYNWNYYKIFMQKYKLSLKDLSFKDFKVYLFALFKAFIPKKKIKNLDDLEHFIQTKSAWVTQVTLYNYLKTRMGTRYVLHFDNEEFLSSINKAKWNIYYVALQDLTFYSFSYLNYFFKYEDIATVSYTHLTLPTKA